VIRCGPYPAGFENGFITDLRIPRPDSLLATKAAQVVKAANLKGLQPGSYLIKYGKHQYLEAMCEAGSIRIAPAASYDDPSLNPAIRDQELELYIQPTPLAMRLEVIDHKTGKPKATFNPIGNKITRSANTNYFVYCLSTVLVPCLFLDFDADACVIITKPADFIERAVLGMRNTYGQRYIVDFEMTTTVGTAVVRSTWIMLTGEDVPRLTSCYVL
jgi:hypothetical protein